MECERNRFDDWMQDRRQSHRLFGFGGEHEEVGWLLDLDDAAETTS